MANNKKATKNKIIVIRGSPEYVNRMYNHLRKEHPSTRKRMTRN